MGITSPILNVREHSDDDIPETAPNLVVGVGEAIGKYSNTIVILPKTRSRY